MTSFNIRADYFALAHNFRGGADRKRPYPDGVFVDPETPATLNRPGVFLVATDGHRMAVFHDAGGTASAPAIVAPDTDILRRAMPGAKRGGGADPSTRLVYNGAIAQLVRDESIVAAVNLSIVDETYPDWIRVVPREAPVKGWASTLNQFNAEYLAAFGNVAKRLTGSPAISFAAEDPQSPAVVRCGCPDFFGVLMPLRGAAVDIPEWLTRATGKAEAA